MSRWSGLCRVMAGQGASHQVRSRHIASRLVTLVSSGLSWQVMSGRVASCWSSLGSSDPVQSWQVQVMSGSVALVTSSPVFACRVLSGPVQSSLVASRWSCLVESDQSGQIKAGHVKSRWSCRVRSSHIEFKPCHVRSGFVTLVKSRHVTSRHVLSGPNKSSRVTLVWSGLGGFRPVWSGHAKSCPVPSSHVRSSRVALVTARHVGFRPVPSRHGWSCRVGHGLSGLVSSRHVLSNPVSSWQVPSRRVVSRWSSPVWSWRVESGRVVSCQVMSRPVASCPVALVLSCLVELRRVMSLGSCQVLSGPVRLRWSRLGSSHLGSSRHIRSRPVQSGPVASGRIRARLVKSRWSGRVLSRRVTSRPVQSRGSCLVSSRQNKSSLVMSGVFLLSVFLFHRANRWSEGRAAFCIGGRCRCAFFLFVQKPLDKFFAFQIVVFWFCQS